LEKLSVNPGVDFAGSCPAGTALAQLRASPIHGQGWFAATVIPAGTRILEYVGEKIDKAESLRRCQQGNTFIFSIDAWHDLDGDVEWNPARWLNHSCAPNAQAEWVKAGIWIIALRAIQTGEEITFDYGYDLDEYQGYPCRCQAPNCVGFIVATEFHDGLRKAGQARAERI
jgi:SET domain-containing protein